MTASVKMHRIPNCNFCSEKAKYDFKTKMGPWAYGCQGHFEEYRAYKLLGLGKGQELIQAPTRKGQK